MKICVDCGNEIDRRATRCRSCATKKQQKEHPFGIPFKIGERAHPETEFKTKEIVLSKKETIRRNNIRKNDRRWFIKNINPKYMHEKEVHHDWGKGEICCIFTHEEHKSVEKEWRVLRNE